MCPCIYASDIAYLCLLATTDYCNFIRLEVMTDLNVPQGAYIREWMDQTVKDFPDVALSG